MFQVRCSLRYILSFSLKPHLRRDILGPNPAVGYEVEAPPCPENTFICRGSYPSCLCYADGRDTKCAQSDNKQYGRYCLQLACRHARPTSGITRLVFLHACLLIKFRKRLSLSVLGITRQERLLSPLLTFPPMRPLHFGWELKRAMCTKQTDTTVLARKQV